MKSTAAVDIDAYIAEFPPAVQKVLKQVRAAVRKAAPDAEEAIKYNMPTYVLQGNLVYFAAFKNHLGFFSVPKKGDAVFLKQLSRYKMGKGSIQFPYDQPMPLELITKIVKYRAKENLEKKAKKAILKKR